MGFGFDQDVMSFVEIMRPMHRRVVTLILGHRHFKFGLRGSAVLIDGPSRRAM